MPGFAMIKWNKRRSAKGGRLAIRLPKSGSEGFGPDGGWTRVQAISTGGKSRPKRSLT